jgi:hypothetical protein
MKFPNIKQYTPADKTDVMTTWKRFGFIPPSEDANYQRKWTLYKYSINAADYNIKNV